MDDLLLVNVSRLQDVRVDPGARSVRVGAGVKWDRVAPRLSAHGLAGLHGSSPDVGIAGYSLGGGMGWLARKHGLQTNAVTALELVTADGELIRVDAEHEPELFWALRGGGGNFGIVTAIEFDVVEVDELYAGAYFFPFERADEVLHTWNAVRHSFPDELMSWASLLHFPPIPDVPAFARGRSYAVVMAAHLGSAAEGASLLRAAAPARPGARHVRQRAAGRARRPRHGPARPGAVPEHLGAARRAAARGDRRHAGRGGPGIRARPDRLDAAAAPDGRRAGPRHAGRRRARHAAGRHQHVRARRDLRRADARGRRTPPWPTSTPPCSPTAPATTPTSSRSRPTPAPSSIPATWARLRAVKAAYDPADVFVGNHHIPPA